MTTPEQQDIIDRLAYMGWQYGAGQAARGGSSDKPHYLTTAAEMLKALISENAALKQGAGEPVLWSITLDGVHTENTFNNKRVALAVAQALNDKFPEAGRRAVVPLYTRPATPLADEPELLEALKRLLFAAQTTGGVAGRDEGLCAAIDAATAVIAKVVAHTKGAKG